MAKLYNLARMTTATAGTGTITLGSAVPGFLTFAQAGVADGDVVSYGIKDGSNSEVGTGTYTASGTTLTRSVTKSTNSNNPISLSGSAEVYITVRAEDMIRTVKRQVFTSSGTYAPSAGMIACIIECIGGGGGGGGAASVSGFSQGGAGGGAGSKSIKYATAANIGASQTVTIGAAGSGGAAGNNGGGAGGDTSVGTLCVGKGGSGGQGGYSINAPQGGAGGSREQAMSPAWVCQAASGSVSRPARQTALAATVAQPSSAEAVLLS